MLGGSVRGSDIVGDRDLGDLRPDLPTDRPPTRSRSGGRKSTCRPLGDPHLVAPQDERCEISFEPPIHKGPRMTSYLGAHDATRVICFHVTFFTRVWCNPPPYGVMRHAQIMDFSMTS